MSEIGRATRIFERVAGKRDGFPRRTELNGFIACDVARRIAESFGITRTMVTILRLREIQLFGFCAATGTPSRSEQALPSEAKTGSCVVRYPTHRDAEQTSLRQSSCVFPS
jgi:hypothetical protein